ncbi:putative dead box ATP-dependent RNA helicase [Schistosoma mansoni]|uniref:putative dead box ATP-dependent RNA helicase n=1 Tax=Schistosoma mansoni TaxID=6183 RepID=UPI00022DC7F1|nr:putative dead box ATP-dependent RNA helicase [Schistosoma mansoni]|eukprot:XP_018650356.1 putative dead box ATP-dependent RNA helicase [Schistosoma mansoni]
MSGIVGSTRGLGSKYGLGVSSLGSSSDVVQIRLQGDSYPSSDSLGLSGMDMFGGLSGYGVSSGVPYYVDSVGGSVSLGGGMLGFDDELGHSGLDNSELVQLLGGSQAIAQLSDSQLEELGRAQFTIVDPRTDSELANCPLSLSVEEDDRPLDEDEILCVTKAKCLDRVRVLSVPASGYTSINTSDLAKCINLRELDLSENALRVFPRRLHLPQLTKLSITGNRFIHLPLFEQFPKLVRLNLDDKLKQLLNPQMLVYFCPKLKYINGIYFEEMLTDFTVRIIQEARSIMEPIIRSKWETDFADQYPFVKSREERMSLIENMMEHIKERNLLIGEALNKYKDLLLFRCIDEFLRSLIYDATDRELLHAVNSLDTPKPITDAENSTNVTNTTTTTTDVTNELFVKSDECALFDAADELLGTHLPDLQLLAQSANQLQTTFFVDSMGRLHQQQVLLTPNGACQLGLQTNGLSNYQLHLGRSLRQGRSIVMTVVRPRGISGRPVAEFLPGELRNKDYVKGYMASEIYKKAVKDTLGQKTTPKKRTGTGKIRKSDQINTSAGERSWPGSTTSSTIPLGELNTEVGNTGAPTKRVTCTSNQMASSRTGSNRPSKVDFDVGEDAGGATGGLPPRPKKRKSMGMHRSLRDLCSDAPFSSDAYNNTTANTVVGGGPRSDATPIDYDPLHFIRCHAKDNDAGDSETKVWRCLFEPNPMRPDETTHVVATCGGECVCLINCETGKVMKRFKHMEEEFYTIAWTTVEVEGSKRTNILAAAGRMHEIRLLHPEQLVCYAEMKGHTEDVTAMIFHQTQSTILFSGDSKASVIVWDIGIPSVPDYKTRYQLLMRLRCPRLDVNPVLNLVFLPHYAYLIAGCEDGLFAWKITDLRLEKREREPDMELKLDFNHEVCIDALAQLSDNALVLKVVESGEIMVFDFASILERRKGLQRVVPIEMRGHLLWQKTDEIYINVSVRQNLGAVLCGDNEGSIWIYDLDPYLDDLHSSSRKRFHVKPIKGFRNPVVNSVEMSSDGLYLAAVTDNNLVCIWRYAPPQQQQYSQIIQQTTTPSLHQTTTMQHNNNQLTAINNSMVTVPNVASIVDDDTSSSTIACMELLNNTNNSSIALKSSAIELVTTGQHLLE